jgi:D-3-phosphoglycerate dehydrogenase
VFAAEQVNINGQTLGTKGGVGYVITDVDAVPGAEVISKLHDLPETIRLRQLN